MYIVPQLGKVSHPFKDKLNLTKLDKISKMQRFKNISKLNP